MLWNPDETLLWCVLISLNGLQSNQTFTMPLATCGERIARLMLLTTRCEELMAYCMHGPWIPDHARKVPAVSLNQYLADEKCPGT